MFLLALVGATIATATTAWATPTTDAAAGKRGGHLTVKFPHWSVEASAVAVQPDNEIVAAGIASKKNTSRFALARVLPNGRFDPGFGDRGRVTTTFNGRSGALAVALQPDGKILAAGFGSSVANANLSDFLIARYLPDGRLDPGFGSAGRVTVDFGGDDYATSLDVRPDGRILVAGGADYGYPDNEHPDSRLAIARLNADGSPNSDFRGSGKASTSLGGFNAAYALTVLPDESISIAGLHTPDPGGLPQDSLAIARYHSNGSLDPDFGNAGTLTRDLTTRRESGRVRDVQPFLGTVEFAADGSIVAATEVAIYTRRKLTYEAWISRFTPNGSPDPAFGADGYVSLRERTLFTPDALSLQADGSLYLAGYRFGRRDMSLALVHLAAGGSLDRGFGRRGRARIPFRGLSSYPSGLAIDAGGRIVVAGSSVGTFSPHTGLPIKPARIAIARYTAGGQPDHSFGARGRDGRGSLQPKVTLGARPSSLPATELRPPVAASPCRAGSRSALRRRC